MRTYNISLGAQHFVHQNRRFHPISAIIWQRSYYPRGDEARVVQH